MATRISHKQLFAIIGLLVFAFSQKASADPLTPKIDPKLVSAIAPRVSGRVADNAFRALSCATNLGEPRPSILALVDYSLPSTKPRFWLIDLIQKRLLLEELVAHGRGSGDNFANKFSNIPGSLRSSLGLYRVGDWYEGMHGPAVRLIGLEKGFNDRAYERDIVLHGASYVDKSFIHEHQRLGRSWGCPALSPSAADRATQIMSSAPSFLYVYYPDSDWLKRSPLLDQCSAVSH